MWRRHYTAKTVIITVSLPLDILEIIHQLSEERRASRSDTIGWLLHLGLTYLKILEEEKYRKQQEAKKRK